MPARHGGPHYTNEHVWRGNRENGREDAATETAETHHSNTLTRAEPGKDFSSLNPTQSRAPTTRTNRSTCPTHTLECTGPVRCVSRRRVQKHQWDRGDLLLGFQLKKLPDGETRKYYTALLGVHRARVQPAKRRRCTYKSQTDDTRDTTKHNHPASRQSMHKRFISATGAYARLSGALTIVPTVLLQTLCG